MKQPDWTEIIEQIIDLIEQDSSFKEQEPSQTNNVSGDNSNDYSLDA